MPSSQPINSPYRSYRPAPASGNRATPQYSQAPVGTTPAQTTSVPKKTDLVSPQYERTRTGTDRRSTTQSSGSSPRPRRTTVVQKTKIVVKKAAASAQTKGSGAALKGGFLLFFLVLGFAIAKDLLDLAVLLMDAIGAALTGTVVGSVVGIPLAFVSEVVDKIAALMVNMTFLFYFWYIGGRMSLRLVVMSIGAIIDAVPVMNALPITSITFVLAFVVGRAISKIESNVLGSAATSIISKRI